ncbi:hypothetical protein CEXT_607261 [Caerostris extrusa]|uniref:Uncharacterized protein n=1 Tax=Caerostris extrusa TaxID=172846 RepID=A0AAV4R8I8_CAEEX|nr:hypothetical protein CEXT_607261 [Caerostris extrusa]
MGIAEDVPQGNFKYLRSIPANGRILCLLLRSAYLAVKLMEELVRQCLCDSRRHIAKISTSVFSVIAPSDKMIVNNDAWKRKISFKEKFIIKKM